MEEYRKVFEDVEISNFGNCRRLLKNGEYRTIKGSIQNRGYRYFQICRKKKRTNKLFHHMVAQAFIGDRPEGLVIDHIDRDKLNNNVSNLRYITFNENLRNCDTYRDDIKLEGKERHNTMQRGYREKTIKSKKLRCLTCPMICNIKGGGIHGDPRQHRDHMNSELHLKRLKVIEQMKEHNIDVTPENYKKIKYANADYRRGRRKIKPIILI